MQFERLVYSSFGDAPWPALELEQSKMVAPRREAWLCSSWRLATLIVDNQLQLVSWPQLQHSISLAAPICDEIPIRSTSNNAPIAARSNNYHCLPIARHLLVVKMHATNNQQSPRHGSTALRPGMILAACFILTASLALVGQETGAQVLTNATTASIQQQQQQANALQTQLNQIQQQAQRQLSQLNGMVLNAVSNSSSRYNNVLDAISSVGKVIHQQISAATNPNHVNIVTNGPSMQQPGQVVESANSKKNEYQAIQTGPSEPGQAASFGYGILNNSTQQLLGANTNQNYREQGEFLRQEIARRAGQLQQVVASSMDLLKNNGDMIMRRLLEQMNVRLDQAKAKADKIITSEPVAMNEVTVKALATINTGLNNLNNIISNIVARMDSANKQDQQQQRLNQQAGGLAPGLVGQPTLQQRLQQAAGTDGALPPLLDTTRFKANLHQLSQQFQQALNGSTLHQQLALIRQQRLQQQALTSMGTNQAKAAPMLMANPTA